MLIGCLTDNIEPNVIDKQINCKNTAWDVYHKTDDSQSHTNSIKSIFNHALNGQRFDDVESQKETRQLMDYLLNYAKRDQGKEPSVISGADTVIEPDAVMVKFFGAAVASSAVLGVVVDMGLTELTVKLMLVIIEFLVSNLRKSFLFDKRITWVNTRTLR